ncbi:MAG: type II toxin-antitoxin system HigB family toxin [Planctomycetota bacterium]|nr:MAG: type II toxin-antitoxin system HigB family toxin [Planctomycetota bacterium]REJ90997.1 MAG: type II toxin-antitoxin system HigB family toxin [Planctomycetota bacterium]REK31044.1 MAG: type II toxin-antitoxin system HigB family toxin [Planctomycetota bacterium]REK36840.1 MAG: type II toxin-antitoxin system HigB family toxin [Planctomycetota bacterium]
MHVISQKKLREFWAVHPEAEQALRAWLKVVENCDWENPHEVTATFNRTSFVGKYAVFRVHGNACRIVAHIHFNRKKIYLRHVVTRTEYDEMKL